VLRPGTLCTISKLDVALAEMRRVLKPGGVLHLSNTATAPRCEGDRWQQRIEPLDKRSPVAVTDPTDPRSHEQAGFAIDALEHLLLQGGNPNVRLHLRKAGHQGPERRGHCLTRQPAVPRGAPAPPVRRVAADAHRNVDPR